MAAAKTFLSCAIVSVCVATIAFAQADPAANAPAAGAGAQAAPAAGGGPGAPAGGGFGAGGGRGFGGGGPGGGGGGARGGRGGGAIPADYREGANQDTAPAGFNKKREGVAEGKLEKVEYD